MENALEAKGRTPETTTLRDLVEARAVLVFECAACLKLAEVDVLDLIARYGADAAVGPLRFLARCRRCGRRRARPLIRFSGERGNWAWWPRPPTW